MTKGNERVVHVQKHAPFRRRFFFEARNGWWQAYVSPFEFGRVEFSPQRCPNLWQSSVGRVGTENPLGSSLLIMQCMDLGVICFACTVVFVIGSKLVQFSSWWDLKLHYPVPHLHCGCQDLQQLGLSVGCVPGTRTWLQLHSWPKPSLDLQYQNGNRSDQIKADLQAAVRASIQSWTNLSLS